MLDRRTIATAVTVFALGGLGAVALADVPAGRRATAASAQPIPVEVRTVVVTKVIHRVRHQKPS